MDLKDTPKGPDCHLRRHVCSHRNQLEEDLVAGRNSPKKDRDEKMGGM